MAITRLSVEELRPGMELAQTVLDDKGRTMLQEGSRLTPMFISRMGKWGVTAVLIRQSSDTDTIARPASTGADILRDASEEERSRMRKIAQTVQTRFSNLTDSPLNAALKKITVRHLITLKPGSTPGIS